MSNRNPTGRSRKTERFNLIPIFSKLRGTETSQILKICEEVKFAKDDVILKPGDSSDEGFYIILGGRVDIRYSSEKDSEPITVATLSDRSVFGEMSFLAKRPRSGLVLAVQDTRVNRVRGDQFRALLEEGNLAAYKVIHNFALLTMSRLRRVETELLQLLDSIDDGTRKMKLKELQQFRNTLFQEWSF